MSDEDMTADLDRCAFEPGRPRRSIETLLHAFTPAPHVDHTHPDAIIAIACSPNGAALVQQVFGIPRAMFPDLVEPGSILGPLLPAIAADTGLAGTTRLLKNTSGLFILQECVRARGTVLDPAPAVITRAVLRGLAASLATSLAAIDQVANHQTRRIHIVGGGSRIELLCQAIADCANATVIAGPVEATTAGNLLVQAASLGVIEHNAIRTVMRATAASFQQPVSPSGPMTL
jgi:sugar (pentulose or hexulose) kinase